MIGCRLGNKSVRIYLRQTKLTLQLWTEYGFILSLSHKIPEPPFCKIFASLLYRLHMFFQVSFQDRVLVSLFYQSKLLFSKDSTSIVPHLYIIAVNGELTVLKRALRQLSPISILAQSLEWLFPREYGNFGERRKNFVYKMSSAVHT